jgi:hypothetical protein
MTDTMLLPIQTLLARLSSETGVQFTLISPDTVEFSADEVFKVAAIVDLASRCAEVAMCFPDNLRETLALGSNVFPADNTVMGQPRERVATEEAGALKVAKRGYPSIEVGEAAQVKLAEAGRKSWVTRRQNEAKAKPAKRGPLAKSGQTTRHV